MSSKAQGERVDIVLVHGLFIGAWAWRDVVANLPADYRVHCPELPFRSLADDAEVVRKCVSGSRDAGRSVLLLGHSYGGMVISEAGFGASRLAFLAALAPDPGQTSAEVADQATTPLINEAMIASADGTMLGLDPGRSVDALYNECTADNAAFGIARHRPAPSSIFADPVDRPAWLERPSTYIVCSQDRALDPGYQERAAARMGTSATLPADHSAFFSAPKELAAVIADLASKCFD